MRQHVHVTPGIYKPASKECELQKQDCGLRSKDVGVEGRNAHLKTNIINLEANNAKKSSFRQKFALEHTRGTSVKHMRTTVQQMQ